MVGMSKARMENRALPKRFYLEALAAPSGEGWAILLDGKPVKTPARQPLVVTSKPLADAIAEEWRAQKEFIDAEAMPLTRLATILIDRAGADREGWIDSIAAYAETDLVCYRAEEGSELAKMQHAAFEPVLAWIEQEHGLRFQATDQLMPIAQPAPSLSGMRTLFAQANDHELVALAMLVPLLGSAVLGLALWKGRLDTDQAIRAARLDEAHNEARWGRDEEAARAWALKEKDIRASAFFPTHASGKTA